MAKVRQYSSPVLLQSVVRSSLYTGVVIAGPIMNPWKKAFAAVCPYVCQALASGLMISVVSRILLLLMYTRDGLLLVCSLPTAVCTEALLTVFHGYMMKKQLMSFVSSHA